MGDIKAIWFDLDDTLYDHTYSVCLGMDAVRARYPVLNERSTRELAAFYNQALNLVYTAHVRGEIDFHEMRRRKLKLFYELSGIDQNDAPGMDDFHRVYDEGYGRERRATPGSVEALERFRNDGVSLGILTNGKQAIQEDKLRIIGLEWMIPNLLTAERAKATKPDPRIYVWALAQTGLDPENVVMVGDSVENDVEAALRCGLSAVLYAPNEVRETVVTAHGIAPVIKEWSALPDLRRDGAEPRHQRTGYAAPRSALTS
jgi:putative hydrolase of the HAD superfamily